MLSPSFFLSLKKKCLLFAFTLFAFQFIQSAPPPPIAIGDKVPEISLPNPQGQVSNLSELKGDLVLVHFWSTWCATCSTKQNPEYVRLYEKYQSSTFKNAAAFNIYSIAFDKNPQKWLQNIEGQGMNWPHHVLDKDIYRSKYWKKYKLKTLPTSYLIDGKGKVIGINLTYEQLDAALKKRQKGTKKSSSSPITVNTFKQKNVGDRATQVVYKIQLGTYKKPDFKIFDNINSLGKFSTESTKSGKKKVLLGTFSKQIAKQTLKKVQQKGYKDAFIVKRQEAFSVIPIPVPLPIPNAANTTASTTSDLPFLPTTNNAGQVLRSFFKVQIGTFKQAVWNRFSHILHLGPLSVEKTKNNLSRVLIGKFTSKAEAQNILQEIQNNGFKDAFVTKRDVVQTMDEGQMPIIDKPITKNQEPVASKANTLTQSMIGLKAPDIILENQSGVPISLSAFENKPIILYFWASWSKEARKQNKVLHEIQKKYKNKAGIYSVAVEENVRKWRKSLWQDGIYHWYPHVIDKKGMSSLLLKKYQLNDLPTIFLLSQGRIIIGENLSTTQLDIELGKLLNK